MNFDVLSFILGKLNCGSDFNDVISYLLGKAVSAVWKTIRNVAVASFTAVVSPLKEFVINIMPVQSGTGDPSPDNVRPISGWTGASVNVAGKNLFNVNGNLKAVAISGSTIESFAARTSASGTTITLMTASSGYQRRICIGLAKAGVSYAFSLDSSIEWYISIYDGEFVPNGSVPNLVTWTGGLDRTVKTATLTPDADGFIYFSISGGYASTTVTVSGIQVEVGSSATDYEAYNGTTYPISWQTEAGTVYGGTLDVTTGLLTITDAYLSFDGTEGWTDSGTTFYTSVSGNFAEGKALTCNMFVGLAPGSGSGLSVGQARLGTARTAFIVKTDLTLAAFKTLLGTTNLQVVIPLATPQTVQLTPIEVTTLLGYNNIFADTGDIIVITYREK